MKRKWRSKLDGERKDRDVLLEDRHDEVEVIRAGSSGHGSSTASSPGCSPGLVQDTFLDLKLQDLKVNRRYWKTLLLGKLPGKPKEMIVELFE